MIPKYNYHYHFCYCFYNNYQFSLLVRDQLLIKKNELQQTGPVVILKINDNTGSGSGSSVVVVVVYSSVVVVVVVVVVVIMYSGVIK